MQKIIAYIEYEDEILDVTTYKDSSLLGIEEKDDILIITISEHFDKYLSPYVLEKKVVLEIKKQGVVRIYNQKCIIKKEIIWEKLK